MSKRWLVIVSLLAHGAVLAIALFFNAWRIDRLGIDYLPPNEVVVASLAMLDPGGGSAPPAAKPETPKHDKPPTKHKPPVPTQPVIATAETPPDLTPAEIPGDGSGSGPGTSPGPGSGPRPGDGSRDPCPPDATCVDGVPVKTPPPPPPPPPPVLIAPGLFKALRISGETQIVPSEVDQNAIVRDGRSRVAATVKLCIDRGGKVFGVSLAASSRYPGYDQRLLDGVRDWRYRPYLVDLQPVPACSVVTFIYAID